MAAVKPFVLALLVTHVSARPSHADPITQEWKTWKPGTGFSARSSEQLLVREPFGQLQRLRAPQLSFARKHSYIAPSHRSSRGYAGSSLPAPPVQP